jgi:isopentenyl-diphosphate delta-isomerase type 1
MANIVFVDENDNVIGAGSKKEARENGIRHRVSRIFLLNKKGETLMTKRASHLAVLPGKWSESASGHVDEGENYDEAAVRELQEEVGVSGITLKSIGKFYYEGRSEGRKSNRFNTVYVADYDGPVKANPEEVAEARWIAPAELEKWMNEHPDDFTEAARRAFQLMKSVTERSSN